MFFSIQRLSQCLIVMDPFCRYTDNNDSTTQHYQLLNLDLLFVQRNNMGVQLFILLSLSQSVVCGVDSVMHREQRLRKTKNTYNFLPSLQIPLFVSCLGFAMSRSNVCAFLFHQSLNQCQIHRLMSELKNKVNYCVSKENFTFFFLF